jgi:putative hydrolase of HD superfamily
LNPKDDELEAIEAQFEEQLQAKANLLGMSEIMAGPQSALGRLAHLCGQLRFQRRWSQIPRIPETSVLGHMFIVACYAFCMSLALGAGNRRRMNTFFTGLFHDLPELLTRDIISPVKRSVQPITEMIKEYEEQELVRRVLQPLESDGHGEIARELSYYLGLESGSEFANSIREKGVVRQVSWEMLQSGWDKDELDPKDGRLVKVCDHLAAFVEAYSSIRNGVNTDQLQQALWRLRSQYRQVSLGELHIGALLADFD